MECLAQVLGLAAWALALFPVLWILDVVLYEWGITSGRYFEASKREG